MLNVGKIADKLNETTKEPYEARREIRQLLRASEGRDRETSRLTSYFNH